MSALEKTMALRAELWNDVLKTDAYRAFTALDSAVIAMGGPKANQALFAMPVVAVAAAFGNPARAHSPQKRKTKRITQSQIAERVLKQAGEPLPVGRWLEKCIADAINIKGDDPLPNFRSTVSRDKRFYNFVRNGMYFWWLEGVELPEKWKMAEGLDLLDQPSAVSFSSQEGGDGHAADNTYLTS